MVMSKALSNPKFQWPVVGHKNIAAYLQNSIVKNKVSHAYLFFGPAGIGKTAMAESFVNSLVCRQADHRDGLIPCGLCDCCLQIKNRIHPDVYWLERPTDPKTGRVKKNISIDQVRELKSKLSLRPFLDSYKAAVVTEAQHLSQEAANALLKTLEEPTAKTVLIILTDNFSWIPKTIVSRCQVLKFLPVAQSEITASLVERGAEKLAAAKLAALAYGRPGIAINYFSDPESLQAYQEKIKEFLALTQADLIQRFRFIQSEFGYAETDEIFQTLNIWLKTLRDLALIKTQNQNLVTNISAGSDLEKIANGYSTAKLTNLLRQVALAKKYLAANVSPRLTLENFVLNF